MADRAVLDTAEAVATLRAALEVQVAARLQQLQLYQPPGLLLPRAQVQAEMAQATRRAITAVIQSPVWLSLANLLALTQRLSADTTLTQDSAPSSAESASGEE